MTKLDAPLKKILIVDDHPMVREGLSMQIGSQRDLVVCGQAASEDEAMTLVGECSPDLIIVDISLKCGNGIELIKQVRSRYPDMKMLVFSGFEESLYAERAMRAGALGYLNKQEGQEKLIEAIRTVLNGDRFLSARMTRRLVAQALEGSSKGKAPIELLTDRELQIFRMIGQGLASGAIANQLYLSTHTIDTHRENIKRKLGVSNAAELNREAVQWVLENG